jgi:hypothetical protein
MTKGTLIWRAILVLVAAWMVFMAGHQVGTHEADRRCEDLIATASPFAPPKLTPVTRFAAIEGFTTECVFDNAGRAGDVVLWDGDTAGKNGNPDRTCHAINNRIFGLLEKDTPAGSVGSIQLYEDTKRRMPIP